MSDKDMERAEQQAKAQLESIRGMVAALNLDWDRLEELRGERETLQAAVQDACDERDNAEMEYSAARRDNEHFDPEELDRTCEALEEAEEELYQFGREYGEELAEMEGLVEEYGESRDDVEERIQEDPLSIRVRSCWDSSGQKMEPCEFEILLRTGGPAVRILGELDQWNEPSRAWLEYQDWFTPWQILYTDSDDTAVLVMYAAQFYYGG